MYRWARANDSCWVFVINGVGVESDIFHYLDTRIMLAINTRTSLCILITNVSMVSFIYPIWHWYIYSFNTDYTKNMVSRLLITLQTGYFTLRNQLNELWELKHTHMHWVNAHTSPWLKALKLYKHSHVIYTRCLLYTPHNIFFNDLYCIIVCFQALGEIVFGENVIVSLNLLRIPTFKSGSYPSSGLFASAFMLRRQCV